MVCLGNICRSPMAEGVLKKLSSQDNLRSWTIDSAGVGNWHAGEAPDYRAIKTAKKHDIQIADQHARPFRNADFDTFDHVLVMDEEIKASILAKSANPRHKAKVRLLLDFLYPGQGRVVPDPYFDGKFEESYQLIHAGCQAFYEFVNTSEQT